MSATSFFSSGVKGDEGTLFAWAKEAGHIDVNPVRDEKRLSAGQGWHTWTDDEIAQFESHHPIGTKPRLAFALFRYLGVRRSDAVKLGKGLQGNQGIRSQAAAR